MIFTFVQYLFAAGFNMKNRNLIILLLLLIYLYSSPAGLAITSPVHATIQKITFAKTDTAEINKLTRTGFRFLTKKIEFEKVKEYIDSAELLCAEKKIVIPSMLHLLKAEYFQTTGDLIRASEEAESALKQSALSGESGVLARTYIFLGRYYQISRFYKESIAYFDKSIAISKEKGLKGLIPAAYLAEADVFRSIGDLKNYRRNLQMLINTASGENDPSSEALGYSLFGTSFCGDSATSKYRDFRKADSLLKKSLEISYKIRDTVRTAYALANSGWNFYLERMYDSSLAYYEKSLKYSIPARIYPASVNSLGNIGTIYRDLAEPEKAIRYYSKAIEMGEKIKDVYNLRWIYEDMSKLYLKGKDTSNAFQSYVLFKKYNDLLITKENSQGLADTKLQYETDAYNKELELLSLRLKNNRLLNYGFTGFIILSIAIGLLLLRASKLKNKRRISEMNRKISEITQANLRQQMNPHFIFNTLNSIQYYMYQHDNLATNNYLTKFANLMRKVLDNSQHTSIPLNDELIALKLYLELECIRFKDKFDFKINLDEDIDPLMYKVPTMLIQPYVENSICHGLMPLEGKGYVRVDLKPAQDHLLCTIEDNGVGREASKERNSKRGTNHNSLGTRITTSRLDMINALYGTSLKTVYTDLMNEKGEATGTRVEIHIPIIT